MTDTIDTNSEYATIAEAGAHLRVCKRTVINYLDAGKLTADKFGSSTRIHVASILALPARRPRSRKMSPEEIAARKPKAKVAS